MSKTAQQAGPHAVAMYIDNGQGRRLLIGATDGHRVVQHPVLLARTKAEARQVIAVLRQLADELPGDEAVPLGPGGPA